MPDLGSAVDSNDIYQVFYAQINYSLVGPLQGQQTKEDAAVQLDGQFTQERPYLPKATPGQRIYGTYLPYP
jgi:hypothetical protein